MRAVTRWQKVYSLIRGRGLRRAFIDSTPIPCGPCSYTGASTPVTDRPLSSRNSHYATLMFAARQRAVFGAFALIRNPCF